MKFTMDKFIDDEITGGTALAEFICKHYEGNPDEPAFGNVKKFVINVMSEDEELLDYDFAYIVQDMIDKHCRDLWICWVDYKGVLNRWWITGDFR